MTYCYSLAAILIHSILSIHVYFPTPSPAHRHTAGGMNWVTKCKMMYFFRNLDTIDVNYWKSSISFKIFFFYLEHRSDKSMYGNYKQGRFFGDICCHIYIYCRGPQSVPVLTTHIVAVNHKLSPATICADIIPFFPRPKGAAKYVINFKSRQNCGRHINKLSSQFAVT